MIRKFLLILTIFAGFASQAINVHAANPLPVSINKISDRQIHFRGDFEPGGLIHGKMPRNSLIYHNGKLVKPYGDDIVISFGRDAALTQSIKILYGKGKTETHKIRLKKRYYDVQNITGVDDKFVSPSKKDQEKINRDAAEINKAKYIDKSPCSFEQEWKMPAEGVISGVYGSQRVFNGVPKRPHFGLDIANKPGTEIVAPKSGIVTLVNQDMFYTGKTVMVNHGCGVSSIFIHMSKISVRNGKFVWQGQKIGEIGTTGRSTGPHLHWGVYHVTTPIDPELLVGGK